MLLSYTAICGLFEVRYYAFAPQRWQNFKSLPFSSPEQIAIYPPLLTNPLSSHQGTDHCPGIQISNLTTTDIVNRTATPVVIDLTRDPSEMNQLPTHLAEYQTEVSKINQVIEEHQTQLVKGEPVLDWCDLAVMVRNEKKITTRLAMHDIFRLLVIK